MNDSKEFAHSIDLASSNIRARKFHSTDERFGSLCDAVIDHLDRISGMSFYVACFSAVEDSLSQWRSYCPPGFGYSLGFDQELLRTNAAKQGFALNKCIYDRKAQIQLAEGWVTETLAALTQACPSDQTPKAFCERRIGPHLNKFITFAPYMKNSAFSAEQEWRLVSLIGSNDPRVSLRPGKSFLVPYVPIHLDFTKDSELLWNACIGPTPHPNLASDAATHLFQKARFVNGIGRSSIPYRDW